MKKCLSLLAALGGFLTTTQAGIVLSESFTYADGSLVGAPNSPWQRHDGTTGQTQITEGKLNLTFGNSEDLNASLQGNPYEAQGPTVSLYASFTVNFSQLPSSGGSYFAHFKPTGTAFRGRIWAATANAAPGSFRIGVGNAVAVASDGEIPVDLELNTDYKIVVRYNLANAASTIWLNPSIESSASATATDVATAQTIVSFAFRQANGIGTMTVDNLLVGTAFSDVAGANLPPSISSIANQSIPANGTTGSIPFAIGDDNTPASSLLVTGSSDNQTLVPNGNIVLGGTTSIRNVTVTPAAGQQGQAVITVTVNDGSKQTSTTFQLKVGAPVINAVANQLTPVNTVLGPLTVVVADAEEGAAALNVTAVSSNQQLVPDLNIAVGGAGADRTLTIAPALNEAGVTTITVSATDGIQTTVRAFSLTVHPVLGLLFTETFDRANGAVVDGLGTWISHSGTFQETQIIANELALSQNQSEDVSRYLDPAETLYPSGGGYVFYASFIANFSELPGGGGTYFAHFKDANIGFRARVFATTTDAGTGKLRLGISNGGTSITSGSIHPTDLTLGTDYTVVVRLNAATGESRLWVNPTSQTTGFVDGLDNPQATAVQSFAFRQSDANGGMGVLTVDDLKVGTAFTDVVNNLPPTISHTRNGNNLRLSWPTGQGYFLRSSGTVPSSSWGNVPFTTEGAEDVSNVDVSSGTGFLQLQKP